MAQNKKTAQDYIREAKSKINNPNYETNKTVTTKSTTTAQNNISAAKEKIKERETAEVVGSLVAKQNPLATPVSSQSNPYNIPPAPQVKSTLPQAQKNTLAKEIAGPQLPTNTTAYDLLKNGIDALYNSKSTLLENEKNRVVAENRPNALLEIANLDNQIKQLPKQQARVELDLSEKLLKGYRENAMKQVQSKDYSDLFDYDKAEKAVTETPEYITLEKNYRQDYANVKPIRATAKSAFNQYTTLPAMGYVLEQAMTGQEVDPNNNAFRSVRRGNDYREALTQSDSNIGSFLKGTGLSMVDTLARLPLGAAGVVFAGLQAGSQGAYDAAQRGGNSGQVLASGLATGAAEAGAEYISLGSLLENIKINPKKGFSLAKNVLKQMGVEGAEELTTDIVNDISDRLIMGNKSNFTLSYNNYLDNAKAQGLNDKAAKEAAFKTAFADLVKEGVTDFAGGALSGGVFAGAGNIPNIAYALSNRTAQKAVDVGADTNSNVSNAEMVAPTEKIKTAAEIKQNQVKSATRQTKGTTDNNTVNNLQGASLDNLYEAQFGNNAERLKHFSSEYSAKSQRNFATGYNSEMDSADYAATFNKIYNASRNSNEAKLDKSRIGEYLGTVQPNMSNENLINTATRAWFAGQNDRNESKAQTNVTTPRGSGTVTYEGNSQLQNTHREALESVSKAIGIDIVVSDKIAENGYFDRNTGKIYINSKSQQPLRAVFNHELTHAMQAYQTEAYTELKEYMATSMNKHNAKAWETAVNETYVNYSKDNDAFTYEMAEDEVIAKTCESFIESPESFEELAKTNKSLAQKFVQGFKSVLRKFVNAFKTSKQSIDTMTLEQWKTAESKWVDILVKLSENENINDIATSEQIDKLVEVSGAETKENLEMYANYKYFKHLDNLTSTEVKESLKAFENIEDEWSRFFREDYTEERVDKWNYSLKTPKQMEKQNKVLKEEVEYLKRQFKSTDKTIQHTMKEVRTSTKDIINQYESVAKSEDIATRIYTLYSNIRQQTSGKTDVDIINSETFTEAQKIAYDIIDNARAIDETSAQLAETYKEAMNSFKGEYSISDNDLQDFDGGIKGFRELKNALKPQVRIVLNGKGTHIDSVYSSFVEQYGYLMGEDDVSTPKAITAREQLEAILKVKDDYKDLTDEMRYNPYETGEMDIGFEDAVHVATMQILENYFVQPETYTDKQNQRIAKLIEFYKGKLQDQKQRLKESYKAKNEKMAENAERASKRNKITKTCKELNSKLVANTDTRHIPEQLKGNVSALLHLIDPTPKQRDINNPSAAFKRIAQLKKQLNELEAQNNWFVDEELADNIDELATFIFDDNGNVRPLYSLNADEMDTTYRVVQAVKSAVVGADRAFAQGRAESITDSAYDIVYGELKGKKYNKGEDTINVIEYSKDNHLKTLNPVTVLENFIGGEFGKYFSNVKEDCFNKTAFALKDVGEWCSKVNEVWSESDANKIITIDMADGTVELTHDAAMQIYATMLDTGTTGGYERLMRGGAVIKRKGKKGIFSTRGNTQIGINSKDFFEQVVAQLTPTEKKLVESRELLEKTSDWGNEVSMAMYGYKKFTNPNYFPRATSGIDTQSNSDEKLGTKHAAKLRNISATKSRIKNANNPIEITGWYSATVNHAIQMAYYRMVPSLTDFERLYNARTVTKDGKVTFVKRAIETAYGENMTRYIENIINDINGSAVKISRSGLETMFRNFKGGAMSFNPKVIALQPTSIIRALAVTNLKYVNPQGIFKNLKNEATSKAFKKSVSQNIQEMSKYSGRAIWKDLGFSNIDLSGDLSKTLTGRDKKIAEKYGDAASALPQFADSIAWAALWDGAKLETSEKNPDLEKGSAEYWKQVDKYFSRDIDLTQQIDSPFHKSEWQRSNNPLVKITNLFMGEPTVEYNMLTRAIESKNKKIISRTIGAIIATKLVGSLVAGVIKTARAKSDDKDTPEELLNTYLSNVIDNTLSEAEGIVTTSPLTNVVVTGLEGIYGIATGNTSSYGFSIGDRPDLDVANNLFKAMGELFNRDSKKSLPNRMLSTVSATASVLGVPVDTIYRDYVRSNYRSYIAVARMAGADTYGAEYNVQKLYYNLNADSARNNVIEVLAKAELAEADSANAIRQDFMDTTGMTSDVLNQKIKSAKKKLVNEAAKKVYEKHKKMFIKAAGYAYGKEGDAARKYREQIAKTYHVSESDIDEAISKLIKEALKEDEANGKD